MCRVGQVSVRFKVVTMELHRVPCEHPRHHAAPGKEVHGTELATSQPVPHAAHSCLDKIGKPYWALQPIVRQGIAEGQGPGAAMGNSMAKQQAAGQARMMERQLEMQQEMRARAMAAQVAGSRDLVNFMGAFGVVAAAGLSRAAARTGNPAFLGPLVPFSFVLAYQADFAYGDKVGRITRHAEDVLSKERHLLTLPGGALTLAQLDATLAARASSGALPV